MPQNRLSRLIVGVVALGACRAQEPSVDPNTLLGRWGGVNSALEGRATSTILQLPCDRLTFAAAMTAGPDGRYVVPVSGRGLYSTRPLPPVLLRGHVVGVTVTISLVFVRTDTTVTQTFVVAKDAAPTFNLVCAAS